MPTDAKEALTTEIKKDSEKIMKKTKREDVVHSGIVMKAVDCVECGIRFSVQHTFYDSVVMHGNTFYCPAGHNLFLPEEYKKRQAKLAADRAADLAAEKAKKELDALERQAALEKTLTYRIWHWFTI